MDDMINSDLIDALREVTSTIIKCEKSQEKFAEGTSQYSLLRNRIKALYISKLLIENELSRREETVVNQAGNDNWVQALDFDRNSVMFQYTKEELTDALRPVISIIHKCEKGQEKFVEGTTNYNRFQKIIKSMYVSKALIEKQLSSYITTYLHD